MQEDRSTLLIRAAISVGGILFVEIFFASHW